MKKLLLVLTFVALAGLAFAQSSSNVMGSNEAGQNFLTFGSHTLKATYVSTGDLADYIPAGYQPIDGVNSVSCPGTSGHCIIQSDAWVEVGDFPYTLNKVAICLYVDGTLVNGTCWWSGEVPADYSYFQASTSLNTTVPPGKHTVQTQVSTTYGAVVGYYNINYKVFKP